MFKITRDYISTPEERAEGRTYIGLYRFGEKLITPEEIKKGKERWNELKKTKTVYKFRLLDGDNIIYLYGENFNNSSFEMEDIFDGELGVTATEYKNEKGEWEML